MASTSASLSICPYLLADGHWRSAEPSREHRCTAVEPPAALGLDKQRRLCLDPLHVECPTRLAAIAAHESRVGFARSEPGRFVRTAPTVLERSRSTLTVPDGLDRRRGGQAALILLMVVALAAVVVSRLPTDRAAINTTAPTPLASATVTPSSSGAPSRSASTATSQSPAPSGSPVPSATATPTSGGTQTYRVKSGDTLSKIAAQYHTTVNAIQQLNGIKDPRLIRIGQILRIP